MEEEMGEVWESEEDHIVPGKQDHSSPVEKGTAAIPQYEQFVSDYNSFISMYFDSELVFNVEEFQPGSNYHQQMSTLLRILLRYRKGGMLPK